MKNKNSRLFLASGLLLAACASDQSFREGQSLILEGRVEEGLARLEEAVREAPGKAQYRAYLRSQRERAVNQSLTQAMSARLNGRYEEAAELYRRARRLDPRDQRVAEAESAMAVERTHAEQIDQAEALFAEGGPEKLEQARGLVRKVLAESPRHREARALQKRMDEQRAADALTPPRLKSALTRPITLEFRDANLRAIFEVISHAAGINFVFDKDVRPDLKATIFVRNTHIEDAVQLLLVTNQLERKVLSENSIMIYPNTPAKQRDYQDLVMKTFYLANADVKQAGNMIRAMLKTRDLFIDERLNLLMIRDTPDAIRVAEKLIASHDLAEPEAILEVEVLEVSRGRLESIGLQWPKQIGYGLLQGGTTTQSTTPGGAVIETTTPGQTVAPGVVDLRNRGALTTFVANPALLLNLNAQDTAANVLANPRIRVKNREKAKIHIGDKVPVLTSTATATGFVSQSITYLDVGVKLDVEANVGLDEEVTMKVGLEVSSIAREITTASGTVAYQVGTRAAGTTLRLKDGETQVLAGLIQDEDRRNASKVPGIGDLPVLGRLFSANNDTSNKTEIILLITPRIVHNIAFPPAATTEFSAGTEAGIGIRSEGGGFGGPIPGAAPVPSPAPAAPLPSGAPPLPGIEPSAPAPPPAPAGEQQG